MWRPTQAEVLVWAASCPALVPSGVAHIQLVAKGQGYLRHCEAGAAMIGTFSINIP